MASAMIDSVLFANNYSMPEVRQLFDDTTMVQNWLDIESALAQTQAEMGIIPQEAADEISRKAHVENLDLIAIGHGVDAHPSLISTYSAGFTKAFAKTAPVNIFIWGLLRRMLLIPGLSSASKRVSKLSMIIYAPVKTIY